MFFIGDVHACFKTYDYILYKMQLKGGEKGMDCSLQLGDMGIGFAGHVDYGYSLDGRSWFPELPLEHRFIRGNHDFPEFCKKHPNYLGDFGYCENTDIFYVSGGLSIDKLIRTIDMTWWDDEELSCKQMNNAYNLYLKKKPRIVVSHECPSVMRPFVKFNKYKIKIISETEKMLQKMFEIHKPEFWIFGHHHKYLEKKVKNTLFVGLGECMYSKYIDCIYEINDVKW